MNLFPVRDIENATQVSIINMDGQECYNSLHISLEFLPGFFPLYCFNSQREHQSEGLSPELGCRGLFSVQKGSHFRLCNYSKVIVLIHREKHIQYCAKVLQSI